MIMAGYINICLFYSLIVILSQFTHYTCAETPFNQLSICRNYQACGSKLRIFPLVEESIGEIIEEIEAGSGDGSGHEHEEVHMLYDEFVTAKTPFDFGADPQQIQKRLCKCSADETNDDQKCDFDATDNLMKIDPTLSLSFCQPPQNSIRLKCIGGRHMVRVMGKIHESGEALTDVTDTAAFCTCPAGVYERSRIEPWSDGYVFSYRCAK